MAFNALTTPDKEIDVSCLQAACIKGDIETVNAILNYSPDKLDSAIAVNVKIGHKSPYFPGKSILTVLRQKDSTAHKQLSNLVENVTKHFQCQSLVHLAARKGNTEHLRRLLYCGEHVDSVSPDLIGNRETPLMMAARFNDVEVVEYLVERGASLDVQDAEGFAAIHHAVMGGKISNILRLIEFGANHLKGSDENKFPVHLAADQGHTNVIRLLVEHGADVKKVDDYGMTPLMYAARNGHLETIKFLLKNGCSLHRSDGEGTLPVHFAAQGDHVDVVKFIAKNGGSALAKTNDNQTVLHYATRLDLVRFLVENGADIHARDCEGKTPLHAAAAKGQTDTVNYFLNQGADINACDDYGFSAVYNALEEGHATVAKVLIDKGCHVKLTKNRAMCITPGRLLTMAASKGLTDIIELLLQRGLQVNAIDDGETPLITAVRAGHCATVAFLLDQGANINGDEVTMPASENHNFSGHGDSESDDSGGEGYSLPRRSPLYCALEVGQGEVAKLLIKRGADTSNIKDGTNSLAQHAAEHGLSDILELLGGKDNFHFDKVIDGGDTLLASAAGRGDVDSLRFLLQNGANVNAKNLSGDTALTAVFQYHLERRLVLETVKLLLSFGADINAENFRSETPLKLACLMNFDQAAELLLELGCKTRNEDSYTPMHHAAEHNNGKLVEMLIQCGADANVKDDLNAMTPLHLAATVNSVIAAQVLLKNGVDKEVVNKLGETPLSIAASRGNLPMVQLLIESGSNVHTKDKSGKTPLIRAVERLRYEAYESTVLELVQILLDQGSSVNATDLYGRCPIHYVSRNTTGEFFDLLLRHGACVNLPDENRETPLHFAATAGNTSCIERLLEHEASVGALDVRNRTALHAAAYEGHSSSVELLIQHDADFHLADNMGWLPINFAAVRGHVDVVRLLVENGSEVAAVDKKGRSALHLAAKGRCIELVEFLIHHGADINARDLCGQTVLGALDEYSLSRGNWNFVQTYLDSGGDPYAVDGLTGKSVLHIAAAYNFVATLDNLVNQGLEIEARDKCGNTPLHRAAENRAKEMIQGLVERGANLSALNNKGLTPLLISLISSKWTGGFRGSVEEGPEYLLKHGSSVYARDRNRNTALHFAVRYPILLKEIIKIGGDVNAINKHGSTPLHKAACEYSADAARVLLKAGANVHCRDDKGNTPLHVATAQGRDEIAKLLMKNGSDVCTTNIQGKTCMHLIALGCEFVEELFARGVQVDAVDELGSTPLHLALLIDDLSLAEVLLKHGSDSQAVDYKGSTPLHIGCCSGSREAVSVIINQNRR